MKKLLLIIIIAFCFTEDTTSLTISYTTGVMEFEESDAELDYNNIGLKYNFHTGSSSEWGAYYDFDLEGEGDINLLGTFMRSYLQEDEFSPFLELNVGLALTEVDNYLTIGGKLGGKYSISNNASVELAYRYLYFETDYQEHYISSVVLGYSFSL